MWDEKPITLLLAPKQPIRARIITLTRQMAETYVMDAWWDEDCLDRRVADEEIDRYWNWNAVEVEFGGKCFRTPR